ncbi:hypothetical protein HDU78_000001 [Chytriomyces hyalinus]|nr:hypothetical protein HDU78_000001 [Chytriomyces hyalinus]
MDFDLLSLTNINPLPPPPIQFSVMQSAMIQLDMSIDPTLQLTPMLLETDRLCLDMFGSIPFEPTPLLHHPDVFAAAVQEYSHHHPFDLFHSHDINNHFNSHAPSQEPPFPLRIDTSDLQPSSNHSNITRPLSNSPPQTPVFLPMSIVAPRLPKVEHIREDDSSVLAGCPTVVAAEASPPQSPCDNSVKAENRLIDLAPSDRASRSSRTSQRRHGKATNAATAQKRVECILRKALSVAVPPESNLCRKTLASMSPSRNTDSELSNSPCRKPRVGGTIKSQKKRYTLSEEQALTLKACFEENRFLQPNQATELAVKVGMSATQVKIWFQNRRAYGKRKGYRRKGTRVSGNYSEDEVGEEEDGLDWE